MSVKPSLCMPADGTGCFVRAAFSQLLAWQHISSMAWRASSPNQAQAFPPAFSYYYSITNMFSSLFILTCRHGKTCFGRKEGRENEGREASNTGKAPLAIHLIFLCAFFAFCLCWPVCLCILNILCLLPSQYFACPHTVPLTLPSLAVS